MVNTILKVKEINKNFNEQRAVDNISFTVNQGEIMGLLGPNGAGKTTVIRMIMGIFEPDSGQIELDKGLLDKRKIGYLPEERGIYDDTLVLETILYFADLKGMKQEEARRSALKWLDVLALSDYANHRIEDLSKGMQQKVQFIISIIHKPRLIVFDEVFSGLDPVNQDLFKKIIKELGSGGTTILLSSHRMDMVEELCDRIFMINHGQKVLFGEIDQIKDEFGEKKVKIKVGGETDYFKRIKELNNLTIENDTVTFSLPAEISAERFIKKMLDNIEIEEISILKPSLHEIFVSKVRGEKKYAG